MLVGLLLLSVFSSSLGSPVVASDSTTHSPLEIIVHAIQTALATQFRTKQDIIWSCIATIFACTWVAVHPNLPGPGDSGWTRFKRQTTTMIYAMIAPEFVALWAMMQWIAARRIVREFNDLPEEEVPWYQVPPRFVKDSFVGLGHSVIDWFNDPRERSSNEWTLTHGFMIQMGGFILYDGDTPKRALTFSDLKCLIEEGEVDPPRISGHEISDKSKGDFLTKLVVVLQTTWFVFQCLARWAMKLPVTELEVATLAFASLNIVTYGLWWKKPQNVLVAMRIQLKNPSANPQAEDPKTEEDMESEPPKESWIVRKLRKATNYGWPGWVFVMPFRLVEATLRPMWKMGRVGGEVHEHKSLRVPIFFVEGREKSGFLPFLAITVAFGALHLIPWSYHFPTPAEQSLWRTSALVITIQPMVFILALVCFYLFGIDDSQLSASVAVLSLGYPGILGIPLYVASRLFLLILAFITMRDPPPGWDTAVAWTSFLPHV